MNCWIGPMNGFEICYKMHSLLMYVLLLDINRFIMPHKVKSSAKRGWIVPQILNTFKEDAEIQEQVDLQVVPLGQTLPDNFISVSDTVHTITAVCTHER